MVTFIGCLTGFIMMLIGAIWIAYARMNTPPSQAEIDQLKLEAIRTKDPDEQALRWMHVSDAEAELWASGTTNPLSWIVIAIGLSVIIASILLAIH